ncbi:uncharacterized protein LOC124434400 [Xenia sp. Carnegie-2017]|uniref:uncharacterized protein LOC124434400 n=1 Tax=Xenia sp. Carnegie-2017 TaxID=2897299 RepID=UPI001F03D645|nr:uncharacterized protein LOC124434400 [Xenia sp. Carnegie-2017]
MSLVCIVFFAVIFSIQSTTVAAFSTGVPNKATVWDLFQWKIHIRRLQRDNIIVYGLSDTTVALDNIQIDSAKCDDPREGSGTNGQREFTIRCKCNELSSTFYNKSKSCVLNRRLKQDCQFKTGSLNWSKGWSWDAVDDTLITIDNRHAHGITTGFNVSTQEYNTCSATSLSYSDKNLSWIEATDYFFNHSKPVTFKLNKRWHFSWHLSENIRHEIEGKILKFQITCRKSDDDEDSYVGVTSCLLVKVTGEFNVTSKQWG